MLPVSIAVLSRHVHRSKRPRNAAKLTETLVIGGMCCGTARHAGSIAQQFALLYAPVG